MDNFKETFAKYMNDIVAFEWNQQEQSQPSQSAQIVNLGTCAVGKAFRIKAAGEPAVSATTNASVKSFPQRHDSTKVETTKIQPQRRR